MFSMGMMVTCEEESDSDVRVSVLMLRLTDILLVVALGFIVRNADLGASGSERIDPDRAEFHVFHRDDGYSQGTFLTVMSGSVY